MDDKTQNVIYPNGDPVSSFEMNPLIIFGIYSRIEDIYI